jgi:hypothetical protein
MQWFKAWLAGFLATLVFHQAVFGVFWLLGAVPAPPFALDPVGPLGIPKVISLAFWGGVWGLPAWALIRRAQGGSYWLRAILFGAIGPTAVAMLVVFPLKGLPVTVTTVIGGVLVNSAWGLGVGLLMRLFGTKFASR